MKVQDLQIVSSIVGQDASRDLLDTLIFISKNNPDRFVGNQFKEFNMAKSKIIVRNNQITVKRNSDGSTVTTSTKKIGGKHVIKGYSHTPSGRRK